MKNFNRNIFIVIAAWTTLMALQVDLCAMGAKRGGGELAEQPETKKAMLAKPQGEDGQFVCIPCNETFTTQRGLTFHKNRSHKEQSADKLVLTSLSNETLSNLVIAAAIAKAKQALHTPKILAQEMQLFQEQPVPDAVANNSPALSDLLAQSQASHSQISEIQCPIRYCNKYFASQEEYVAHYRMHQQEPCRFCGISFVYKKDMKAHIKENHPTKRTCQCGLKFKDHATLEAHFTLNPDHRAPLPMQPAFDPNTFLA